MKVPFVDLAKQNYPLRNKIKKNFLKVLDSGNYILGNELINFENNFKKYIGNKFCVGVGSGTDALYLSLKAINLKKDDEVLTVSQSYLASASCIHLAGGKIKFIDIKNDLNIDENLIAKKINKNTRAIIVVHLTGRPANIKKIKEIIKKSQIHQKIYLIEDCSQAVGSTLDNKKVGSFGDFGCFSFHPLKNLAALGDGGAVVLNNKQKYNWLLKARNHGHPNRDDCDFFSHNMRLDTLQAGILKIKLDNLEKTIKSRRKYALYYQENLSKKITTIKEPVSVINTYHTYIVFCPKRDKLIKFLSKMGIETKIHYPKPIHKMKVFKNERFKDLKNTEILSKKILSLPIAEYLTLEQIKYVTKNINHFYEKN
jgi:dTDP-4-amino-4,6-dideoxygalactose transaminase